MIQRAQTVYLALAFICMVLLLVFPIFSVETTLGETVTFSGAFGKNGLVGEGIEGGTPIYPIFIVLALFSLAGILLFKNRPRQLMITRINFVLHVLVVSGVYIFYYFGKGMVQDALQLNGQNDIKVVFYMSVGFFLLIPAVAFVYLAIRGIKKDQNLLSSLDRLR